MVVCAGCGVEPSAYELYTIPPLIESLDPERHMILSSFYGAGEAPSALCARCFNAQVSEVNRLFAVALASASTVPTASTAESTSTAPMESKAVTTSATDEKGK